MIGLVGHLITLITLCSALIGPALVAFRCRRSERATLGQKILCYKRCWQGPEIGTKLGYDPNRKHIRESLFLGSMQARCSMHFSGKALVFCWHRNSLARRAGRYGDRVCSRQRSARKFKLWKQFNRWMDEGQLGTTIESRKSMQCFVKWITCLINVHIMTHIITFSMIL